MDNKNALKGEQTTLSFSIRISESLHGDIKAEAEQINSSMNSFMMVLLKLGLQTYQGRYVIHLEQQ